MSLADTKTLLGIDNERVELIHSDISARLLRRLKRSQPDLIDVPEELEYIVTEVTIARYNRIGSEGMTSESMDGHSANYAVVELKDFESDIQDYLDESGADTKQGKVRFL